ncbi:NAD(P)-dependent oxidoreductase [Cupriavidus metallidurans]|uniref:NAD(P)-dependent oxidoreductase n=1 Tax=Cupriavidus metallidurans TaxID=119219 RepID=UPI0009B87DC6|nr:NAD(P)-dependent oxidoreductase [Cupriavidus metallidurans]
MSEVRIGYIGLGAMGSALARRLVATHRLWVWDINADATAEFQKMGAQVASSAKEVASNCDVVLLCLPRTSDVRRLIFGPEGLAEGLTKGKLVVDQTSGIPGETRAIAKELADRGVAMMDAPVSGGVMGAAAGTISIMASGDEDSYQKALPVLTAISPNVFRCGRNVGDGQAMKLVNNLLSAGCRLATLEVVAMGRKIGLPLAAIVEAINKGSARNRTSRITLQELAEGKVMPAHFAMSLMLKDMTQAVQLGGTCGVPMILTNIVRSLLQIGVSRLGERAQLEEVIGLLGSMAGVEILDTAGADDAAAPGIESNGKDPSRMRRLGYVGVGTMGAALARRLMLAYPVQIFDSRVEVVESLAKDGALPAQDLPGLARECDVIFICLPTSDDVRNVLFGPAGLAEGLSKGTVVVDQTTADPAKTRAIAADLARLGVRLVDAPVSGGPRGAVAGTVSIMCGGSPEDVAVVEPILKTISPNLVYCGKTGSGHETKLVQNAVAACNHLLVYEAAALAVKYGLALADVSKVINQSTGWSSASERVLPTLSEGRETADFQLQLMVKDLKLAARMAMECGAPMLMATTVCNLFEYGSRSLGAITNVDAMSHVFEALAGVQFSGA